MLCHGGGGYGVVCFVHVNLGFHGDGGYGLAWRPSRPAAVHGDGGYATLARTVDTAWTVDTPCWHWKNFTVTVDTPTLAALSAVQDFTATVDTAAVRDNRPRQDSTVTVDTNIHRATDACLVDP